MRVIQVTNKEAGQRLDKLLLKYLNRAPKSFIYKMLRKKNITLNEKKADGSEKVMIQDEIKLFLSEETIKKFSECIISNVVSKLTIIYEDKHIILVNKQAGMLSQKAEFSDISLVDHLISYLLESKQITEEQLRSFKPAICNRLDRNTSGIVIAGKSLLGLQTMGMILKNRSIEKYYLCIVVGRMEQPKQIEGYLKKEERTNRVTIYKEKVEGADWIQTFYQPLSTTEQYTLLQVKLITGKSHQIRAHLSSIGHAILGDFKYGNRELNERIKKKYQLEHQLLHAYELIMPPLEGELSYLSNKKFQAQLPEDFKEIGVRLCLLGTLEG